MLRIAPAALAAIGLISTAQAAAAQTAPSRLTEVSRAGITDFARLLVVERKPEQAFSRYFAPRLIQHDPEIADGGSGDDAFLEERRQANPGKYAATDQFANVVHTILADGDLVAIKSHVFTSPNDAGRVFVDIWRVEKGKFIEHWDVIQPITPETANPAAIGCGVGASHAAARAAGNTVAKPACGAPDRSVDSEASRRTVLAYMQMGQQPGKLEQAISTYLAEDFVQHSRHIPPGRQGLIDYMQARDAARRADKRTSHFARTVADGNMVLVHRRVTTASDPRGRAIIDLFRLRDGRIAEHWDVIQPIPEHSVSGRSMVDGPLEPGRTKGPAKASAAH
ncbi:MAG: hypothetical protein JWN59_1267 [Sphingomonas bacterium]|nr:hypothetical protein [Sphingomonas bacterium]